MYKINIKTNLVRIWFTNNRNSFLPFHNQLRMIQLRKNNPSHHILFVTNKSFLDESEKEKLNNFCRTYQIRVVDFLEETYKKLFDEGENSATLIKIFELAKEEIFFNIDKKGGDLAAASDLARLIYVYWGYIYTDFDVSLRNINFETTVINEVPSFLINVSFNHYYSVDCLTNDIIVPLYVNDSLFSLKLAMIEIMKKAISNYEMHTFFKKRAIQVFFRREDEQLLLNKIIEVQTKMEETLYEIRRKIKEYHENCKNFIKNSNLVTPLVVEDQIKIELAEIEMWYCKLFYKNSVTYFSGPSLFFDFVKKENYLMSYPELNFNYTIHSQDASWQLGVVESNVEYLSQCSDKLKRFFQNINVTKRFLGLHNLHVPSLVEGLTLRHFSNEKYIFWSRYPFLETKIGISKYQGVDSLIDALLQLLGIPVVKRLRIHFKIRESLVKDYSSLMINDENGEMFLKLILRIICIFYNCEKETHKHIKYIIILHFTLDGELFSLVYNNRRDPQQVDSMTEELHFWCRSMNHFQPIFNMESDWRSFYSKEPVVKPSQDSCINNLGLTITTTRSFDGRF